MLKPLKILATIKNNNLQMEAIIAKEQAGLDRIYLQYTNKTSFNRKTLICSLQDQAQKTKELVNTKNKKAYIM